MNYTCLVCNLQGLVRNNVKDIFSESNTLPSSRKLLDTLEEILDKPIVENNIHSKTLCRKCYKTCVEYDGHISKINVIKLEMGDEYTTTLQKRLASKIKLSEKVIPPVVPAVKEERQMTTIVVPASKLQPVPADFRLNFAHLAAFNQANVSNAATPLINLKVTIGSSVFTQSLKTSTVKIGKPVESSTNVTATSSKDMLSDWNVSLVPSSIFSTSSITSQNAIEVPENENDDGDENTDKGDENEMEIDEDCSAGTTAMVSENQNMPFDIVHIKDEDHQTTNAQYINVDALPSVDSDGNVLTSDGNIVTSDGNIIAADGKIMMANGNYVKLKLYNEDDDDDEDDTIVVNGDPSILEMMTGQKFLYENGELSLVMQDDDGNDNDDGGQDSNDESQIELQVSGDEETANAIIAAAQERGGAFIKVEGGEMYRVQSVESQGEESFDISVFVTRQGDSFRCVLCQNLADSETENEELLNATDMMSHLKTAHDAKIYICQFCGVGMRKRQEFTKHLADHSKKVSPQKGGGAGRGRVHECGVCGRRYNSRTLLQEHAHVHRGVRPYRCAHCHKAFASKYTHQAHLKTHQIRPRPYKCQQCQKSFLSQQNLSQHEKTHSGIKNFICKICSKAFGTQHNLEVHGVVHSGARPHACEHCHKAFARKAELADHIRIHTGERPFACETCGVRFAQRSNLHSHRRATHMDDKRHACTHCHKRFKRRRLLDYHIKASHTGERPLVCAVCNATFVYPEHYKKHIRIHKGDRPYHCEICGKAFNSRDNRNTHRFTHSDKKPYECLTCGDSYMRKRLLIAHMNLQGHLAESIVVNQPRVTRVLNTESGLTTIVQLNEQSEVPTNNKNGEAILRTTGKLEPLKGDVNVPKENILYINDRETSLEIDNSEEGIDTHLAAEASELATDDANAILRLIQVKMPDGNDGWVALND